jgi:hypothetical protein
MGSFLIPAYFVLPVSYHFVRRSHLRDLNVPTDPMTLNHRVPGSSPGAPTKLFKHLQVHF